ncbi:DUF2384 domain-containing protein [Oxalobacteraceae sp. CFBP 13730]|nr:DUF2384 domain-containing protein [Oxalobacteraceae sp. CFBP 13730]
MTDSERLSPDSMSALQARFQDHSTKAQTHYAVMHEVRQVLGSIDAADVWMTTPQAALGDSTPAQLVAAGRVDDVLACLRQTPPRGAKR